MFQPIKYAMRRRCSILLLVCLVVGCWLSLPAQELPGKIIDQEGEKVGEKAISRIDEEFAKYKKESSFFERWRSEDRGYFDPAASPLLKRPFHDLVDRAVVSIRQTNRVAEFQNANNLQIVDALKRQNQALAPPQQLELDYQERLLWPDTLTIGKAGIPDTATVEVYQLKDYVSEAIDKIEHPTYPPAEPIDGHLNLTPQQLQKLLKSKDLPPPAASGK
jgi:hypothetical protein